jgi:kynurenine 3-monooxygenase
MESKEEDILNRSHKITIIGGGLCGIVLAIYLKKKLNLEVNVYDKLEDPRFQYTDHSSASFNITLAERGLAALSEIGLREIILSACLPLFGRNIHTNKNDIRDQLYGPSGEAIYAIKRDELLSILIDNAEKLGINLNYGVECQDINYTDSATEIVAVDILTNKKYNITTQLVFGTDGLHSKVRESIEKHLSINDNTKINTHDMIYRELNLPANPNGSYRLRNDRLHIWPRKDCMLIGFPNAGGSFTLSLCISVQHNLANKIQQDSNSLRQFILDNFPDISLVVDQLIINESAQKWQSYRQAEVKEWAFKDRALLLGDAAHAFYPFLGQAANSAFEDCKIISKLISQHDNWQDIFEKFRKRKIDTDVIANLANHHSKVLSDTVSKDSFLLQNKISLEISRQDPSLKPVYNNISFTCLPYSQVEKNAQVHEEILSKLFHKFASQASDDLSIKTEVFKALQSRKTPYIGLFKLHHIEISSHDDSSEKKNDAEPHTKLNQSG